MYTLKFVNAPGQELLFAAWSVRRDGDRLYYTNEHEVEIEMVELAGKTVYVMNQQGATVSIYRM
jgi:hypothetical protein